MTTHDDARAALSIGWLAKGLIFVVIGVLAIEIARRGFSGEDADQTGALTSLSTVGGGRLVVAALSFGLVGYAVWQLWSAIRSDATDPFGLARRAGWVGLAVVYSLLAHTGLMIAWHGPSRAGGGDDGPTSPSGFAVRAFELPLGRPLIGLVGCATIGVGVYNAWKGLSGDHLDDLDTTDTSSRHRSMLRVLGVAGFAARGLLLGIAGWLFVDAARSYQPERAAGLDDSLRELSEVTLGTTLLTLTGAGLIAAGLYDMVTFRRQRVGGA